MTDAGRIRILVADDHALVRRGIATVLNAGNVDLHSLLLGPAERADVVVDFSAFAGKTLILYNDAPAAFPARDPRFDYYTDSADLRDTGGVAPALPGYGPNTRTVMQIRVTGQAAVKPFASLDELTTKWSGVFATGQDNIIVGQSAYNDAYGVAFPTTYPCWGVARIQDTSMCVATVDNPATPPFAQLPLQPKAIHDEMGASFDDYGRMSTNLGLEIPFTNPLAQNFVLQSYSDPPTELITLSDKAVPIGTPLADGTQLWKITHNGVDTHPVHFHLFHVQLINRVGWDGAIRLPHPTELGWKDTVRISPLEDTIVALRPIAPGAADLPWKLPNSVRYLEPALPPNSTLGFTNIDPLGNNVTATNQLTNFGWEYIWHCHILSHEEHDMMRAIAFAVTPETPSGLAANRTAGGVALGWTDNSLTATGFTIQRALTTDPSFAAPTTFNTGAPACTAAAGCLRTYTDATAASAQAYLYRVSAQNTVGSTVPGYPTVTAESVFTPAVTAPAAPVPAVPLNLAAVINANPTRVTLTWTDASNNETSFAVWRAANGGAFTQVGAVSRTAAQSTATGGTATFNNTTGLVAGTTYAYYVTAANAVGASAPSNTVTVVFAAPAAPTGLAGSAARLPVGNPLRALLDAVTLTWTDNAGNETGFQIQRSLTAGFGASTTFTVGANVTTLSQNVSRLVNYYYRVRATNAVGNSGWSNVIRVTTP